MLKQMKKLILTTLTLFISSAILFAQEETEKDILITDEIIVVCRAEAECERSGFLWRLDRR